MNKNINPFTHARSIRKELLEQVEIFPEIKFEGKGFICALITSICHVGCDYCMFFSNKSEKENKFNTMSDSRIDKLMKLVEDSNTGYLLVSGGGEPFNKLNLMNKIAKDSVADLTWLVTSGFWAKSESKANEIIENLYKSYTDGLDKKPNKKLCLRISVDTQHVKYIQKEELNYIINIINIFESKYQNNSGFFYSFTLLIIKKIKS